MRIAVLGAGNIGANAARHFQKAGHEVRITGSGNVAKLTATAATIGAIPADAADAVKESEVVLLAMLWIAKDKAFAAAGPGAFTGKIVIDATNPYLDYPAVEDLGGRGSSEVVAADLPGARIVKTLNTLYAAKLADGDRPKGAADRIALPMCGDDTAAKQIVAGLFDEIGFDTADIGPLSSGRRMEPGQLFYARSDPLPELLAMISGT